MSKPEEAEETKGTFGINIKYGKEEVQCEHCQEYKIGMDIARSFRWPSPSGFDWTISYDRETKEILVNEHALMRIIQMVNPAQQQRKLRLVSQDEFHGKKG